MLRILKSSSKLINNQTCRYLSHPPHVVVGMPALSPTMSSGTIGSWHKKVGDSIKAGETFADVETDKASMSFEAQEDAFIAKILVEAGVEVKVGEPILITVEDSAVVASFYDYKLDSKAAGAPPSPAPAVAPAPSPVVAAPTPVITQVPVVKTEPVITKPEISAPQPVPVVTDSNVSFSASSVTRQSLTWGTGVSKSALINKISKDQAAYNEKYGHSLHKPIKV